MSALVFASVMISGLGFAYRMGRIAGLRFYNVKRPPSRAWWLL